MKKCKLCYKCLLAISLALMLVGTIFAGLLQNDFGRVEIRDVTIDTAVGTLTGYLLIPDHEEGEKLPAVVTSHGYLNNREMQDLNYVELSRNGYVVFAMNAYGHGDSPVLTGSAKETVNAEAGGMIDAVEFISTLPYVDVNNIGVTGHSMGGGYTNTTMEYYTNLEKEALASGASASDAKALNKISAGVIIGNFPANLLSVSAVDGTDGYLCDVAVIGGKFDEFYFGMTNGVYGKDILGSDNLKKVVSVQTGIAPTGTIDSGKEFVNPDNGYSFAMHVPSEFHAQNHFSITTVDHTVTFFNDKLTSMSDPTPKFQVWWLKELFNCVALIGMFMFIVPFAKLMMKTPFFSELAVDGVPSIPALKDRKASGKFYRNNVFNSVICMVLTLPVLAIGYVALQSSFFPQDTTGGIGLWSAVCGLIGLLFLRINFGKFKGKGVELGFIVPKMKWLKTALLAILVVSVTYTMVFIADYIFQVDFRIWTLVVRIFSFDKIWIAIKYLPFFAVFYIINSMCLARNNFENWSETKQILISMAFNVLGVMLFLILSYGPVIFQGVTLWAGIPSALVQMAGALIPILVIPFVPILAIAAYLNVKCYKATGNIWLGGLINTILITLITVANTSFSFPY